MQEKDQAERLFGIVRDTLDREIATGDMARMAYTSRSSFFRLFQALIAERPAGMRRRFLLERAAWQLARTEVSVTDIAFDAQYGSLEAFTLSARPFRLRRAYSGEWPDAFPSSGAQRLHFCAPASGSKGEQHIMDPFELFAGNDSWHTARLLDYARNLTYEQLDRPMDGARSFPWEGYINKLFVTRPCRAER
jgi:AraC family transcriptional regulator